MRASNEEAQYFKETVQGGNIYMGVKPKDAKYLYNHWHS